MAEYKIDKTDRKILQMLEDNARVSVKEIAEANFMSSPAVANRIRRMEANDLIIRKEYPQIPPKVEYSLSERGKSLMEVLDKLCIWGEENKRVVTRSQN